MTTRRFKKSKASPEDDGCAAGAWLSGFVADCEFKLNVLNESAQEGILCVRRTDFLNDFSLIKWRIETGVIPEDDVLS